MSGITISNIKNEFVECGIYPHNSDTIANTN